MQQPGKIGFVGLGKMGWPMASHLVKAGCEVTVFDVDVERQRAFVSQYPCTGVTSLAAVGATSELVITMLPDGKAVRLAVLAGRGEDCLSGSMARGTILVDMSSSSPTGTLELGRELTAIGIEMVDAPVSGGVGKAESGMLAIMAGGNIEAVRRCDSIFGFMGSKVFYTGQLGSGHAMKALNNMLSAAGLIAAAEVLVGGPPVRIRPGCHD